ncbi:Inner membrane protein YedI [compost metagenome]
MAAAPYLMKTLSVVGTAAMFMVGGAILTHGIPPVHAAIEHVAASVGGGGLVQALVSTLLNALFGIVAGAVVLGVVGIAKRLFKKG